jgi:UDP-galactopyranose mutase
VIPEGGYAAFFENLLRNVEVRLNMPFVPGAISARKIIYTGAIDEYFGYEFGALEYRSLRFEHKVFDRENVQGNAVINYTSHDVPYTRTIEHRHFDRNCAAEKSVLSYEYPATWERGDEPFYPVNNQQNNALYERYAELAEREDNVIFGGRLGRYKYLDMDKVIEQALELAWSLLLIKS